MRRPKFSVIIPCYNVAGTIEETIASVSAQTLGDLEILAVDNNSTDRTAEVLADIACREPRLKVLREPRQGICPTRNAGIMKARGDFLAFLDGDDLFDPDYFALHEANFADGTVGVSYGRVRLVDRYGKPTGNVTHPPMSGLGPAELLRGNPCTSIVVARREALERVGPFNESLRRMEDQEWLFRAAHAGFLFRGIDRAIASYRIMPGSLSQNVAAMLEAHAQMLEAARRIAPDAVARHGRLSRGAMLRYCARRSIDHEAPLAEARRYLRQMLMTAPDLMIREPVPTAKTLLTVLAPTLVRRALGKVSLSRVEGSA